MTIEYGIACENGIETGTRAGDASKGCKGVFARENTSSEQGFVPAGDSNGLLLKTENNRFGNFGLVSWDGSDISAGGGTKKGRMKARRTVAKRCVPYYFVSSNYTAGFGGFKYQAAGLPAVA